MAGYDRGARTDVRQRRQSQRGSAGQLVDYGGGLTQNSEGVVTLDLGTNPGLDTTSGLIVDLAANSGLTTVGGLSVSPGSGEPFGTSGGLTLTIGDGLDKAGGTLTVDLAAGGGLEFSSGDLQIANPEGVWSITSVQTGTYGASVGEVVRCDPSGGGFTVNLPTASGIAGQQVVVKNVTSSTNTITVDGNGAETIDGSATETITTAWGSLALVSDGTNWLVI